MAAIVKSEQCFLQRIRFQHSFPIQAEVIKNDADLGEVDRRILCFAGYLLQIFGRRYFSELSQKLEKPLQVELEGISRAHYEIQAQIEVNQDFYLEQKFPITKNLVKRYCSPSVSRDEFFFLLQKGSYDTLPFIQRTILYPKSNLGVVRRLEESRSDAFYLLLKNLPKDFGADPEEKEIEQKSPPSLFLSAKLLYGSGALVYRGEVLYYSDLLGDWARISMRNKSAVDQLKETLGIEQWIRGREPEVHLIWDGISSIGVDCNQHSFQTFLIECTIKTLEESFAIEFSSSLKEYLFALLECEIVRLDIAYFCGHRLLENLDFSRFPRFSRPILLAFRTFTRMLEFFEVEKKDQALLLELILIQVRNPKLLEEKKDSLFKDNSLFAFAWKAVNTLSPLVGQSVKSGSCYSLLFFFLEDSSRERFFRLFIQLHEVFQSSIAFPIIFDFCQENKDVDGAVLQQFLSIYTQILSHFSSVDSIHAERLFLDLPLSLGSGGGLSNLLERAQQFFRFMDEYGIALDESSLPLLRDYLHKPCMNTYILFADAPDLKIDSLQATDIAGALSLLTEPLPEIIEAEDKREAIQIALELKQQYLFSNVQTFSLYFETLNQLSKGNRESFAAIESFILELETFCPSISLEDFFFLYRYQPFLKGLDRLKELKSQFLNADRECFILPQTLVQEILQTSESFPESIVPANLELQTKFRSSISQSIRLLFFAPIQPLIDYFKIAGFDFSDQVQWGSFHLITHLGQLKEVPNSSVAIYLDWEKVGEFPVLFFSFTDLGSRVSRSTRIILDVPVDEMNQVAGKRQSFFAYLNTVTSHIFKEQVEDPAPEQESVENWISCFTSLKEDVAMYNQDIDNGLLKEEHLQNLWEFLKKVKVAYRNLYLEVVHGYHPYKGEELESYDAPLLSKEHLQHTCRVFSAANKEPISLHLNLNIPMNGGKDLTYPLSFHVETASDLLGAPVEEIRKNWDSRGLPIDEVVQGKYVTLSIQYLKQTLRKTLHYPYSALSDLNTFQMYFDFHQFLLRSRLMDRKVYFFTNPY